MSADPQVADWPKMADYPQTEAGFNDFRAAWTGRRRSAPTLAQVPMWAVEENRAAMKLAADKGWQESEEG